MAYRNRSRGIPATNQATGETVTLWRGAPVASLGGRRRVLNVPRDVFDLRDRQYQPTLAPLPSSVDHRGRVRATLIRDQGDEGACTGFAMAGVVNHLMAARKKRFDASPRFLYENARRYDEWKGDEYDGSSVRGAMKGFLKHGVCAWSDFPYAPGQKFDRIPDKALAAARDRPVGAYYRVSTSSLNDMQSALAEVGVILVSAQTHRGWDQPVQPTKEIASIAWKSTYEQMDGHAFIFVGYDADGFLVQNSWGTTWGSGGYARLTYEDWLVNRMDAWVCQLGVGQVTPEVTKGGRRGSAGETRVDDDEIRGHYLAIRNGHYDDSAPFRSGPADVEEVAQRIVAFGRKTAGPIPVMLFAHGGLVNEGTAAARTLSLMRRFVPKGIYPLAFIWHTGLLETVGDLVLGQAGRVAPAEGEERVQGWLKDKVIEAKDETLEWVLRPIGGPIWREMKGDAVEACHGPGVSERDVDERGHAPGDGPAFTLLSAIHAAAARARRTVRWHLVGHSAGSILHCRLVEWFVRNDAPIASASFIAPAASCALFRRTVIPAADMIGRFGLHTMADADERDDDCLVYSKSLLYLVSESFEREEDRRLVGLDRNVRADWHRSTRLVEPDVATWLERPEVETDFHRPERLEATLHGSFDGDPLTLAKVEARMFAR